MLSLLLREKPMRLILTLKSGDTTWYLSNLARTTRITFVYLSELLPKLEQAGLVRMEKKGNKRLVALTEKGADIAQLLEEIKRKLDVSIPETKPPAV